MAENTKIAKELERLKREIHTGEKKLGELLKKAEQLSASIKTEIRSRQSAKSRRKN
jgi:hypothetical protein